MCSIRQYIRVQRYWNHIALGIFCIWATLLMLGGILANEGIINDTDQYAKLNSVNSMIWGLFVGWVSSGFYWLISHSLIKRRR